MASVNKASAAATISPYVAPSAKAAGKSGETTRGPGTQSRRSGKNETRAAAARLRCGFGGAVPARFRLPVTSAKQRNWRRCWQKADLHRH